MRGRLVAAVLVLTGALVAPSRAATPPPPPELAGCQPGTGAAVAVGTVACRTMRSAALGGTTAFSYYVPPGCTAAARCPLLYLLHGFGGTHRSMLGTGEKPSAWVRALTAAPPDGFEDAPWLHADPGKWDAASALQVVLVAPHGRTVTGGYGPAPAMEGFWSDWHPRYARDGDSPRYDTPPPRFESMLLDELVPLVERTLPVRTGRPWRAIAGTSLGGFGSYVTALRHPDGFVSAGSVSGAHNFLFAPPVAGAPTLPIPGVLNTVPIESLGPASDFLAATLALGDPVADQPRMRAHMPVDLAVNGHELALRAFVNDTVPRQPGEGTDPGAIALESIVFPMNHEMDLAFEAERVDREFEVHPGTHSGVYWNAWLRAQLEAQVARFGTGGTPPTQFDFRSGDAAFRIWGWSFSVDRPADALLTLRDVTCDELTIEGDGVVTIRPPARCGRSPVTVEVAGSRRVEW